MLELVDKLDSESSVLTNVRVRLSLWALRLQQHFLKPLSLYLICSRLSLTVSRFLPLIVLAIIWSGAKSQALNTESFLKAEQLKSRAPDSAIAYLYKGEKDLTLDDSTRFELHRILGYAYLYRGTFDSSLYHLTSASLLSDATSPAMNFKVENALGAVYQRFEDGKRAIKHYLKGLKIAEQEGDAIGKAKIFNNLSILYRTSGDFRNAGIHARKALKTYQALGDTVYIAGTLNNLGLVKVALQEYDSAMVYYEQSLRLKQQGSDHRSIANTMNNLGLVYEAQDDLSKALHYYMEANALRRKANDRFGQASSCINIGSVYLNRNDPKQALQYIEEGELLSKQLGSPELFERLIVLRADYYQAKGELNSAIEELRHLHEMRDSLQDSDFFHDLAKAEYMAAETEARANMEEMKLASELEKEQLRLQRFVNLLMALVISVFIGMLALLLYQLAQLKRLRGSLMDERDAATSMASERRETLQQAAHEIRTPINSIMSLSRLIGEEKDPVEKAKMNGFMLEVCEHLLKVVNNILSMSRIDEGKVIATFLPVNMASWLEKELAFLRPLAKEKHIELKLTIAEGENYQIDTDIDLLHQVVGNIVGNAIKFTKEGWVAVTLADKNEHLVITIADTGDGIAKGHHRYIFDAFYRATSSSVQGSGLGLSIASKYITMLNGKIEFDSTEKKGSEFRVYLPKKR